MKRKNELPPLPSAEPFHDRDHAKNRILVLYEATAHTLTEYAYQQGRALAFLKEDFKREFGSYKTGHLRRFIEDNLPFGLRTAERYMEFYQDCENQNGLMPYKPSKSDPINDSMTFMDKATGNKAVEPDPEGVETPAMVAEMSEIMAFPEHHKKPWTVKDVASAVLKTFHRYAGGRSMEEMEQAEKLVTKEIQRYVSEEARSRRDLEYQIKSKNWPLPAHTFEELKQQQRVSFEKIIFAAEEVGLEHFDALLNDPGDVNLFETREYDEATEEEITARKM
jgi:hypothetical protein